LISGIPMDFAEHSTVRGLYLNFHFPEVQIHRNGQHYIVTHHGLVVDQADSLFEAVGKAKLYVVLG
jgi:hypothetical protein